MNGTNRTRMSALVAGFAAALVAAVVLAGSARGENAIFSVINTDDTGNGSLRSAIIGANATVGADTIRFNIPGDGVKKISLASELPAVTGPVTIDGYTQQGASENTLQRGNDADLMIELDGQNAGFVNGLVIEAPDSVIKGLVINHFARAGIVVGSSDATNVRIEGNFIGTDPAGSEDQGNGTGMLVTGAENTVGGATPAARNLVSGNGFGVVISGSRATENAVLGNYVGTDRNGATALGNAGIGVLVNDASGNTLGGAASGEGNLISGNTGAGVALVRAARNNDVLGNLIGTGKDGTLPLGNSSSGVFIGLAGADGNTVGGNDPGSSNTIAFNGTDGVSVVDDATGNRILSNSIFSNENLGIDLADDGPTANDTGDGDAGPNDLQNSPVLNSAKARKKGTTIKGKLTTIPNRPFTVQLFSNPKGEEEGKTLLGETSVSTDADGVARFSSEIEDPVPRGQNITATATDSDGNTSEFSVPKKVVRH